TDFWIARRTSRPAMLRLIDAFGDDGAKSLGGTTETACGSAVGTSEAGVVSAGVVSGCGSGCGAGIGGRGGAAQFSCPGQLFVIWIVGVLFCRSQMIESRTDDASLLVSASSSAPVGFTRLSRM